MEILGLREAKIRKLGEGQNLIFFVSREKIALIKQSNSLSINYE